METAFWAEAHGATTHFPIALLLCSTALDSAGFAPRAQADRRRSARRRLLDDALRGARLDWRGAYRISHDPRFPLWPRGFAKPSSLYLARVHPRDRAGVLALAQRPHGSTLGVCHLPVSGRVGLRFDLGSRLLGRGDALGSLK